MWYMNSFCWTSNFQSKICMRYIFLIISFNLLTKYYIETSSQYQIKLLSVLSTSVIICKVPGSKWVNSWFSLALKKGICTIFLRTSVYNIRFMQQLLLFYEISSSSCNISIHFNKKNIKKFVHQHIKYWIIKY